MNAVLLRSHQRKDTDQLAFAFEGTAEGRAIETVWRNVAETAKKNRTVFAQRRLRPEEVLPEWKRTLSAIGGADDVKRFTIRSLARLGAAPESLKYGYKAPLTGLPIYVKERLDQEGMTGTALIDFTLPPRGRCKSVTRSHPLVQILADSLLEQTLDHFDERKNLNDPAVLGRLGCWISSKVKSKTTIVLLRLRHQLVSQSQNRTRTLLVEEASSVAWEGKVASELIEGAAVLDLLNHPPDKDPPKALCDRVFQEAINSVKDLGTSMNRHAERRAQELLSDHRRVREAADARGRYSVTTLLPPDVIGIFVMLPAME